MVARITSGAAPAGALFYNKDKIDRGEGLFLDAANVPIPEITFFRDADGVDHMEQIVRQNYSRIKQDATQIIKRELRRIADDPALRHLLAKK